MTGDWENRLNWFLDRFDWIRTYPRILFFDIVQRPQYLWILTRRDPKKKMSIWMWTPEYRAEIKVGYMRLLRRGRFFEAAKLLSKM